jgi:hypothetical protein
MGLRLRRRAATRIPGDETTAIPPALVEANEYD